MDDIDAVIAGDNGSVTLDIVENVAGDSLQLFLTVIPFNGYFILPRIPDRLENKKVLKRLPVFRRADQHQFAGQAVNGYFDPGDFRIIQFEDKIVAPLYPALWRRIDKGDRRLGGNAG